MDRLIEFVKHHELMPFFLVGMADKMDYGKVNWQRVIEAIIIALIIAGSQAYITLRITDVKVEYLSATITKVEGRVTDIDRKVEATNRMLYLHNDNRK